MKKGIVILGSVAGVLALSFCATTLASQTKTAKHETPSWEDKIVPNSQITVLELARQIIPDIKPESDTSDKMTTSDLSAVRLLDGVEETGMELDLEAGQKHEITEADYFWIKDGGISRLVLLLSVDVERPVIGLFQISPKVTLLDAVTIAQDMHVTVEREKLWEISSQSQAFSVECWHDNSSESFDNYTFISVVNRKLRAVAGPIGSLGFSTYLPARQRLCKTATTPKFQFVRSPGAGYFDLIETETTLKVCHPDSAQWSWKTGVVYQKSVRNVWHWNQKNRRYRPAPVSNR